MPDTIAQLIAALPILEGLNAEEVEQVAGCSRNVALEAGQLLFTEGSRADACYLVRRGRVAIELHVPGRGGLVIDSVETGDVVGWSWLFPPYRWVFDGRAVAPVGAVAIDAACLRAKAEADPAFGYRLVQRFAAQMMRHLQSTQLRLLDVYGDGSAGHATG